MKTPVRAHRGCPLPLDAVVLKAHLLTPFAP